MLSEEQAKQIKEQLLKQLENWPESQRESAKEEIEKMDEKELEEFLIKNNLMKQGEQPGQKCIFCEISKGNIPIYKIAENEKAIAILEINPISKAHTIIIPKEHLKEPFEEIQKFAEQVAKKISETFKPKDVQIITGEMFNHLSINILPIYNNETIDSQRKKADEKELKQIQEQLTKQEKPKQEEKPKKKPKKLTARQKKKLEQEELKKLPKAPRRQP